MEGFEDLLAIAKQARGAAYAPYSRFKVGCALRGPSGSIYAGCNVENASFPVGMCAEASAISAMIAAGERRICDILILGEFDEPTAPCGACRQRIAEFSDASTRIILANARGAQAVRGIEELLPGAFGPDAFRRIHCEDDHE
ncbi:MAG TPA: cytidine deaminase [Beijerinckiaceae bacterium]|nr:cytidine deaminase [Beijerinckiaceae bacterium]